jgi:hypothetical protein
MVKSTGQMMPKRVKSNPAERALAPAHAPLRQEFYLGQYQNLAINTLI